MVTSKPWSWRSRAVASPTAPAPSTAARRGESGVPPSGAAARARSLIAARRSIRWSGIGITVVSSAIDRHDGQLRHLHQQVLLGAVMRGVRGADLAEGAAAP